MAKAFAGYQSESGKIHKTEHDAWLDDLSTVIAGSGLINEPTAAGFVKYLTSTNGAIAVFADIVAHVAKTAPLPEPEAAEPREPERPLAAKIIADAVSPLIKDV